MLRLVESDEVRLKVCPRVNDYPTKVPWSEEDARHVADAPDVLDLAACSALGATPEEAVMQPAIAKGAWLEPTRAVGGTRGAPRGKEATPSGPASCMLE